MVKIASTEKARMVPKIVAKFCHAFMRKRLIIIVGPSVQTEGG